MTTEITLYIDGHRADLSSDALILLNYTQEDLSDPAAVVNSYTQAVTLPATPANTQIFSNFGRSDYDADGAAFDTFGRTPFQLFAATGEILQAGYLKLDKVTRSGRVVTGYAVTLYGGLGDAIYALSYDADGNKRNIGDMPLWDADGTPQTWGLVKLDKDVLKGAWDYLASWSSIPSPFGPVVNFAPCYNGIPEGFDAKKAAVPVKPSTVPGTATEGDFYWVATRDGVIYQPYNWPTNGQQTPGTVIVEMSSQHDEWEMGDLRVADQRPVFNLANFINSLEDLDGTIFGGWQVSFGPEFVRSAWVQHGWLTMSTPRSLGIEDLSSFPFRDLFQDMPSPGELLLGLVKLFGLVITCDPVAKVVHIQTRNEFYGGGTTVDLTDKLDVSSIEVDPYPMTARVQKWAYPQGKGGELDAYEKLFGKPYGAVWLDTGYPFEGSPVEPLKGIPFRNTVDTLEAGYFFQATGYKAGSLYPEQFKGLLLDDAASWALYAFAAATPDERGSISASQAQMKADTGVDPAPWIAIPFNSDLADWLPKPQFCGADGKPQAGAGALLFFEGMQTSPLLTSADGQKTKRPYYNISDDVFLDALSVNGFKPCWQAVRSGFGQVQVYQLPSFRRNHYEGDVVTHSFDIAKPRAYYDGQTTDAKVAGARFPFSSCWQTYLTDRYDKNTRIVRAKVDLSSFRPGQELLRNFYWFDGALWVLNKIENLSLTTADPCLCEFVKVQDPDAYTNGQDYGN